MSFASETQKRSSYRTALVRISPRRDVTDLLATSGGDIYTVTMPGVVTAVTLNGVLLTEVSGTPTAGEWSWDHQNFDLSVHLDPAPDDDNIVIATFNLLFGSDKEVLGVDPEDSDSLPVRWEPRLLSVPEVGSFVDDILAGVLSYANSTVEISDPEGIFAQEYLTINDSFRSADCTIWAYVNETAIQKMFTGEVSGIRIDMGRVSIMVSDKAIRLGTPAYMGDDEDEAIFLKSGFPNIYPQHEGFPNPFTTGRYSRSADKLIAISNNSIGAMQLDPAKSREAVLLNYSNQVATTTNRVWGLCRIPGSLRNNSFTSLTTVLFDNESGFLVHQTGGDYQIGDTFRWTQGGVTYAGDVVINVPFTISSVNYNLFVYSAVRQNTPNIAADHGNMTTSSVSVATPSMALSLTFGPRSYEDTLRLRYGADYTHTETTTAGGNNFVSITLKNNIEGNHFEDVDDPPSEISPENHQMYFRLSNNAPLKHGDLLKRICLASGMTVDSASFDQADADLDAETYFQIPTTLEQDYNTYLKYAEQVCKSTMGYLTADAAGRMVYRLIEPPTAGDSIDENTSMLLSTDIDYNDIVTGLIAVNADLRSETESLLVDNRAAYLHNLNNVIRFYHVLLDISARLPAILEILKKRKVTYGHAGSHLYLAKQIGDNISIEHPDVLGGSGNANTIITGIRKTMDGVKIESMDLGAPQEE